MTIKWSRVLPGINSWGRVTHICVVILTSNGSDNGLSPGRRQTIICTNAGMLLIRPFGTNLSEILIGIQTFSFKKMHLKMSSAKWRPFFLGLNVLIIATSLLFPMSTETNLTWDWRKKDLTVQSRAFYWINPEGFTDDLISNPVHKGASYRLSLVLIPGSKVHGANMRPTWGRQDPGGPHVGPMKIAIWDAKEALLIENTSHNLDDVFSKLYTIRIHIISHQ